MSGDWCAHVTLSLSPSVCECVCVTCYYLIMIGANGRLQYLRLCLFEMYVNVVFVTRFLSSTVSVILVGE